MYDFNKVIKPSSGSGSLKHDLFAGRDIIPMWVADMDFPAPVEVVEAIKSKADSGFFGYTIPKKQLKELIVSRIERLYSWHIEPDWLVFTAGLVSALNCICRGLCSPGQEVTVFTPAYPPFLEIPEANYCKLSKIPMINSDEYYTFDYERFEDSLNPSSGLVFLCNPHNPSGRVHTISELENFAEICLRNNLPIVSDEIHCELVLDNAVHTPIASLSEEIRRKTITLMSPSKTFNMAGLMCGFAIIPDLQMREKVRAIVNKLASHPNAFGYEAAYAAYKYCEPWRVELLKYLTENRNIVYNTLSKVEGLRLTCPEATYLSWIDCRAFSVTDPVKYFEKLGVALSDGKGFGAPGYLRLNFACSRTILQTALKRIVVPYSKR